MSGSELVRHPDPLAFMVNSLTEVYDSVRHMERELQQWGALSAGAVMDAVLVGAELIGNAMVHTLDGCVVRASWEEGRLLLEVADTSSTAPREGRGSELMDAVAHEWGWRVLGIGKIVYAYITPQQWCTDDRRLIALLRRAPQLLDSAEAGLAEQAERIMAQFGA